MCRLDEDAEGEGGFADRDRDGHKVLTRIDRGHAIVAAVRDVDVPAVRGRRNADGNVAERDRRADHGIGSRIDHRHAVGEFVPNINLRAVRDHRNADRKVADRDRGADHGIGSRIDHRHIFGSDVRDVGVLRGASSAADNTSGSNLTLDSDID